MQQNEESLKKQVKKNDGKNQYNDENNKKQMQLDYIQQYLQNDNQDSESSEDEGDERFYIDPDSPSFQKMVKKIRKKKYKQKIILKKKQLKQAIKQQLAEKGGVNDIKNQEIVKKIQNEINEILEKGEIMEDEGQNSNRQNKQEKLAIINEDLAQDQNSFSISSESLESKTELGMVSENNELIESTNSIIDEEGENSDNNSGQQSINEEQQNIQRKQQENRQEMEEQNDFDDSDVFYGNEFQDIEDEIYQELRKRYERENALKTTRVYGTAKQSNIEECREILNKSSQIIFLTGAGISVASGIKTYRGEGSIPGNIINGKFYSNETLATKFFMKNNSEVFWKNFLDFYGMLDGKTPSSSHTAIAKVQCKFEKQNQIQENIEQSKKIMVITQNVDNLHCKAYLSQKQTIDKNYMGQYFYEQRFPSVMNPPNIYQIHGNYFMGRCSEECCAKLFRFSKEELQILKSGKIPMCPFCNKATVRPQVLYFDECYNEIQYKIDSLQRELDLNKILDDNSSVSSYESQDMDDIYDIESESENENENQGRNDKNIQNLSDLEKNSQLNGDEIQKKQNVQMKEQQPQILENLDRQLQNNTNQIQNEQKISEKVEIEVENQKDSQGQEKQIINQQKQIEKVEKIQNVKSCLVVIGTMLETNFARQLVNLFVQRKQYIIEINIKSIIKAGHNTYNLSGKSEEIVPQILKDLVQDQP